MKTLKVILFVVLMLMTGLLAPAVCYWSALYACYWLGLWAAIPIGIVAGGLTLFACSYAWVVAGFALLID